MTVFLDTWNVTFEGLPADNEAINLGAGRIRALKIDVRQRLAVDHSLAGDANDGLHLHVELMPQGVSPVMVNAGDGILYSQVINSNVELLYKDSGGNNIQITGGGVLAVPTTLQGSFTMTGNFRASGGIGNINGDATFALGPSSFGYNALFFASNTFIQYNSALARFEFYVAGVIQGHIP